MNVVYEKAVTTLGIIGILTWFKQEFGRRPAESGNPARVQQSNDE